MRRPLGSRLLRQLLLIFVLAKPSDPFMSRSGNEPRPLAWVYECEECHRQKRFRDERLRRPICHQQLMKLVRSPEGEE